MEAEDSLSVDQERVRKGRDANSGEIGRPRRRYLLMSPLRVLGWGVAVGVGLVGMAGFQLYSESAHHIRVRNTKATILVVEQAMIRYDVAHSNPCPPSLQALVDERYLNKLPRDEWGQPLQFACPGLHNPDVADVSSAGKDRRFGTTDDINSWDL
jgi:hypothetical protein